MSNDKGFCGICANCVPQIGGGSGFNNCEEAHAAQMAEDKAVTNNKLTDAELAEILSGVVDGVQPTTHEIAMARELQEHRKAEAAWLKFQGMLNTDDPAATRPVFFIEVEGDDWIAAGEIKDGLKELRDGIYHLYTSPQLAAAGRDPVFFVEVQGGEDVQAGRIPGSAFDFNNLPDGINKLYAGPQPMTDEERAPGEITEDEELCCLIASLGYYVAKPDMAAKQLPHLLAVVADAAEQLREFRASAGMGREIVYCYHYCAETMDGNRAGYIGTTERVLDRPSYHALMHLISKVNDSTVTGILSLSYLGKNYQEKREASNG